MGAGFSTSDTELSQTVLKSVFSSRERGKVVGR